VEQSAALTLERHRTRRLVAGVAITLAVAVFGLFIVKWSPYYAKTFVAAARHSLGNSILTGTAEAAKAPSWSTALSYAAAYFAAIWQALVLALLLGACIQVLVPRQWIARHLTHFGARTSAAVGMMTMAGMMCTCCVAPVVAGLRKQKASPAAAMAIFIGNPTLNPAVLLFIGFVLSWPFAALRLVVGLSVVIAAAWLAGRLTPGDVEIADALPPSPIEDGAATPLAVLVAWLRVVWWELYTIVPGYIAIVLALGALRAWLFHPGVVLHAGGGVIATIVAAIAGTLFVIPTAGEIPIIQTFARFGLGSAPAAALLLTLPAISVPSMFIVRSAFPARTLAAVAGAVAAAGIVAAIVASALGLTLAHP
jgi:uncharacterized membrane protein YraQ (UPF0718 family)